MPCPECGSPRVRAAWPPWLVLSLAILAVLAVTAHGYWQWRTYHEANAGIERLPATFRALEPLFPPSQPAH